MFVLCLSKLKLVEQNHKVTVTCRGKELFGSAKQTEGTILFRAKADISENRRRGRGADKRTEEFTGRRFSFGRMEGSKFAELEAASLRMARNHRVDRNYRKERLILQLANFLPY